jgi:ABC-type bacteriocin/lantibiotic exporter with double-glycine peptidase domain
MFALNALAASFLQPVGSLVLSAQRIQLAKAYLERIADVMQAEPEQKIDKVKAARDLSGTIELREVEFEYSAHGSSVLHGVSLKIRAGQKIAIVGRTGSGKSTLAKLLLGLYLPSAGEILYDGAALDSLSYPSVRRQWGVVMQDAFVFSASVRENIAFNNPRLPMTEIVEAARRAGIHEEINAMAMGYETRIGEGGSSLSGGQRQRLAIARALAAKPRMLLLDEATSQLDVVTEELVDRNLNQLGCTRVVVAHRLSTVRNADLIVVMRDGCVAERGTHKQLMALGREYATLVMSQHRGSYPTI